MTTEVRPPPRAPSGLRLLLGGTVGLALGLGLVWWSMGHERPELQAVAEEPEGGERASRPEPEPEAPAEAESPVGAESEPEPEPEPAPEAEAAAEADADSEAVSESDSQEEAAAAPVPAEAAAGVPGSTRFERGRVAFLRCGEPNVRCGRDRDFEEAAWAILGEVSGCAALAGRRGSADVRIHRTSSGKELRFRDWGDTPLPVGALQGCLEAGGLSALPIGVEGNPLIVSFRFRLR